MGEIKMYYYPPIEKPAKVRFSFAIKSWALSLWFLIYYDGELVIQFLCIAICFPKKENGGWL